MSTSNKKIKFATTTDGRAVVVRHTPAARFTHWIVGMLFIVASLTGLAFFHPALSWIRDIFGGGTWNRILHPIFGIFLVISFASLALRYGKHNNFNKADIQWLKQIDDVVAGREDKLPPIGMYNAGQKILFWTLSTLVIGLLITGVMLWYDYHIFFSVDARAIAALLHAFFAFTMIGLITVHVLAAILAKGSIGAMLHGKVTYAWAKHNHSAWYKKIVDEENAAAIKG